MGCWVENFCLLQVVFCCNFVRMKKDEKIFRIWVSEILADMKFFLALISDISVDYGFVIFCYFFLLKLVFKNT
jgi:hypothetical protein